jgi:hypothetical protein
MSLVEWSAVLGNIGEFLGSIAVLATLIYLAVQVRYSRQLLEENRKIALSQVYQGRSVMRIEGARQFADSGLAHLSVKVFGLANDHSPEERAANFDQLEDVEKVQFRQVWAQFLWAMDNTLYQNSLGLIDDEQLFGMAESIRTNYLLWQHMKVPIPDRIQAYYEDELQQ